MKGKKVGMLIGVAAVVVAVGASVTVTQQNEYKVHRRCQRKLCYMIWQLLM